MKETKFKQTEVGMIPSDWEVKTLGELVDMSSGTTPSRFNEKNFQGNVCWLSSGELKSHYIYNTKEKISEAAASTMRLYPKGTVVIAMYGLEAEGVRGTSSILAKECTISQACMAFTNLRKINNEFFYYWYAANGDEIGTRYAQGTKQQNLSPEVMKNVVIPLPPTIEEQQRIANALSDVDTLIANLEKLIAKKKNIKQGAMQQLLTGRKRLPGFAPNERTGSRPTNERRKECHSERSAKRETEESSGYKMTELGMIPSDWEVKNLGSITQNCSYGVGAEAVSFNGRTKYIRITDIDDDSHRFIPSPLTSPSFYENKHVVQENDLLIARTGASVGKTYLYDSKDGKLIFAGFLIKMNVCEANSKFVFYSTLTKYYQDWIVSESARTGQPGVNLQQMKKLQIALPPTIEEQTAIANVLSDMDAEISALETKLAKYRTLKTGMMQQLLTGKIRLV